IGKAADARTVNVAGVAAERVDQDRLHARPPRAPHIDADDVTDVDRPFRRDSEALEGDGEDARVRLLDADHVRIDHGAQVRPEAGALEVRLDTTIGVRHHAQYEPAGDECTEHRRRIRLRDGPEAALPVVPGQRGEQWPDLGG